MRATIGGLLIALLVALLPAVSALTVDQVDSTLDRVKPGFVKDGDIFGVVGEKNTKWVSQSANYFDKPTAVEETKAVLYRPDKSYSPFRGEGIWNLGYRFNYVEGNDVITASTIKSAKWIDKSKAKYLNAYQIELQGKQVYLLMLNKDAPSELNSKMVDSATYTWLKARVGSKNLWMGQYGQYGVGIAGGRIK